MAVTRQGQVVYMDADGDTVEWPLLLQAMHTHGNLTFSDSEGTALFDTGDNSCCITFPMGLAFPKGLTVNGSNVHVVLFLR